jgi:hypothetical protein
MRQIVWTCNLLFTLLFITIFCGGTKGSDTLELPKKNVSVSAFETEEVRMGGQKRYRILTDRYVITAARTEDGIRAGERLEHLFNVWELLFAPFLKEAGMKRPPHESAQRPLHVVLYRDQQEYTSHLQRIDPFAVATNGYYSPTRRTAYFFSPETKVLLHEGTHQIFEEYFFRDQTPVFRNNFWVVEGMAMLMETLKIEDEHYKIGDILDDRLYAAKEYQFRRNYNLPIRSLTAMSAAQIQRSAEIQRIYSQSAALVHWLMFAEEGCYREHLLELLRQTYLGTAKPETLSSLTGLSYGELDRKYVEFLKMIPDEE